MQTAVPFPDWLKRQRKTLDLSRAALADHIYCSISAIRRMEAGDLRPSRELASLLATALGVPATEQEAFIQFARGHSQTPPRMGLTASARYTPETMASSLPAPLTSLVGRQQEITAVCDLLHEPGVRLLTLTGPPGTGKTRLSLAVAAQLDGDSLFAHGAFFVPLAPVTDPHLVIVSIAQVLGVTETSQQGGSAATLQQALHDYLRSRQMLLLLDNFEQILPAAALVTELLMAAPGLKVIITSREVLHVYGEHEFPVPPLPVPDVNRLPTQTAVNYLARFPAIRLFQERVRAVQPGFQLSADNVADVARICAWLDGLPLAIEMVAAQMKWQSPAQVFAQLSSRLAALTGGPRDLSPRQQSLEGAISWSYNLLQPEQQQLFARLGIFVAGCDEEAVRAMLTQVAPDSAHLTETPTLRARLQALVEKNLLIYQPALEGNGRYTMLETLREYALAQLQAQQLAAVEEAHALAYLQLAETAAAQITSGGSQAVWLDRLEVEYHNLRAAFTWVTAVPSRSTLALTLAEHLYHFWFIRGHLSEGRTWLEKALTLADTPNELQARIHNRAGQIVRVQGDLAAAQKHHEQALEVQQQIEDTAGMCRSLESLAIIWGTQGEYGRARDLLEQTLHLRHQMGDPRLLISTLNNLAIVRLRLGDLPGAEALYLECVTLCQGVNDLHSLSHALHGLGEINLEQGKAAAGLPYFQQAIALRHQLGNRPGLVISLGSTAMAFYQLQAGTRAAKLLGASRQLSEELGIKASARYQAEAEAKITQVQQMVGEALFAQAWAEGQKLSLEEAIQLASAAA